jgi:hypothetical protein
MYIEKGKQLQVCPQADCYCQEPSEDLKKVDYLFHIAFREVVRPERFELPTYSSGGCRSIQLSYGRTADSLSVHRSRNPLNVR